ncbi:MAG: TonB family protein [Halieaceae bacterium]
MTIESNSVAGIDRALSTARTPAHYGRVLLALLAGTASALFLAWFMQYLISSSDLMLSDVTRVQMLDFVRVKREEQVERKDRKPPRPQLEETPEVPPMPQNQMDASGQQLAVSMMPADAGISIDKGGIGFGAGEGDYLPIVKVAPIFPQRALALGIFGECLVQYTVTTAGTVKDVVVIKDRCTAAVFYRSSVEAALRFKYKPRVIDGVAVEVQGVLNMFYYQELDTSKQ